MFANVFPGSDILKRCSNINITVEGRIITGGITGKKKKKERENYKEFLMGISMSIEKRQTFVL